MEKFWFYIKIWTLILHMYELNWSLKNQWDNIRQKCEKVYYFEMLPREYL